MAPVATATDGDRFARPGAYAVNPSSGNDALAGGVLCASINAGTSPMIILGCPSPHWALQLVAAAPFRHCVRLDGADALEVNRRPPTLPLQHAFAS